MRDKFPDTSEGLVKHLAEVNWFRHKSIRDMRDRWEVSQQQIKQIDHHDESIIQPPTAVDSGYETMSFRNPAPYAKSVLSSSSFGATTNAEEVGRARYPPPPVKLGLDTEKFRCKVCYQMLEGIDSKLKWRQVTILGGDSDYMLTTTRKHIIRDIRPYSCSFTNYSAAKQSYGTRKEWLAHKFSCHRFVAE